MRHHHHHHLEPPSSRSPSLNPFVSSATNTGTSLSAIRDRRTHTPHSTSMAFNLFIFHFTPTIIIYFLYITTPSISALNITQLLSPYPNLSAFSTLLSNTAVASDLSQRSSLTLLTVSNSYLSSPSFVGLTSRLSPSSLGDLIRYHVLLQFFSWSDLQQISLSGILVTTLFQTTGRASSNFGSVNISRDPTTKIITLRSPAPFSPSNATVLSLVKTLPYNITILSVDSLIIPYDFDLMASDSRPPLGLNITKALIDGHNFNVAASMLSASGVVQEFEADEGGAGITLFVPTDIAFADLPNNMKLQALPADKKAVVLKFHVLHSYYPLGSLESIVNPVQPTLATEDMGAGRFTLNISRVNGSVAIGTGLVQASVTQTVFDQNPVAIFGVSKVFLPREIFGKESAVSGKPGDEGLGKAQGSDVSTSPDDSSGFGGPSSHLSSPPGSLEDARSGVDDLAQRNSCVVVALCCIGLLYVLI